MLPLLRTNIYHKGLQRTANEYAEERRIYRDLISKNNNVDILNSVSVKLFCFFLCLSLFFPFIYKRNDNFCNNNPLIL